MNVVSGLWNFGNREYPDLLGCVGTNEETRWKPASQELNASSYLRSSIGCCTDDALTLKYLLDRARVPNRLVNIPGHVFNEARIAGEWRTLDPTVNVFYSRSWGEMVSSNGRKKDSALRPQARVVLFPLRGLEADAAHRARVGTLRFYLLFLAGDAEPEFFLQDTLPSSFVAMVQKGGRVLAAAPRR